MASAGQNQIKTLSSTSVCDTLYSQNKSHLLSLNDGQIGRLISERKIRFSVHYKCVSFTMAKYMKEYSICSCLFHDIESMSIVKRYIYIYIYSMKLIKVMNICHEYFQQKKNSCAIRKI